MNILTGTVSGKSQLMMEKNGRYYIFVDQKEAPSSTLEAISRWETLGDLDIAETKRPQEFSVPIVPQKMFLPAVNFRSHSAESSVPELKEPYFFCKFAHTLVPHHGSVIRPAGVERLDYEGEIGVIIGKKGKYIAPGDAQEHIFGYTIVDDVSLRDYQMNGHQSYGKDWVMGKNADTALPMGPWIVPRNEFKGFPAGIQTRVNGELKQDGSTEDMIFSIEKLISRLSRVVTLAPGDLITTGTPAGVAEHTSRKYLEPGDTVEISVDGIGTLKHDIIDDPEKADN